MNSTQNSVSGCSSVTTMALCPHIEDTEVTLTKMLKANYNLTLKSVKPLNGYDDVNYHVFAETSCSGNPHIDSVREEGYFLKISNINDSIRPELLHAQRNIMDHLIRKGIVCQDPIKGCNGNIFTPITSPDRSGKNVTYLVSLRTYLPGRVIQDLPLTPKLLFNLGNFTSKVSNGLQDFKHPFYETFDCLWSMNNMSKVRDCLFALNDEKQRQMAEEVILAFENKVLPIRRKLLQGQIHGDLNTHNILVDKDNSGAYTKISGLLDFQDSARSYILYEVAILIAYMLMAGGAEMPLMELPGYILAGLSCELTLPQLEKDTLRICVAARMVMSLVYGAYGFYQDPSNEYLLDTSRFGWQALTEIWTADPVKMQTTWWEIAKVYKNV